MTSEAAKATGLMRHSSSGLHKDPLVFYIRLKWSKQEVRDHVLEQ